jgi:hypothetical protein
MTCLQKVSSRVSALQAAQIDRVAVLVLSGSFNPVHSQHIRALEIARIVMERSGWTIAGGYYQVIKRVTGRKGAVSGGGW